MTRTLTSPFLCWCENLLYRSRMIHLKTDFYVTMARGDGTSARRFVLLPVRRRFVRRARATTMKWLSEYLVCVWLWAESNAEAPPLPASYNTGYFCRSNPLRRVWPTSHEQSEQRRKQHDTDNKVFNYTLVTPYETTGRALCGHLRRRAWLVDPSSHCTPNAWIWHPPPPPHGTLPTAVCFKDSFQFYLYIVFRK